MIPGVIPSFLGPTGLASWGFYGEGSTPPAITGQLVAYINLSLAQNATIVDASPLTSAVASVVPQTVQHVTSGTSVALSLQGGSVEVKLFV